MTILRSTTTRIVTVGWYITLLLHCVHTQENGFLDKVCPSALEIGDPECLHGGKLYAKNLSDYLNCASCKCPPEWNGIDCSLCSSVDVCPDKDGKPALDCTRNRVDITNQEYVVGKQMSCYCGGSDDTSKFVCDQQPGTNWQIDISPADENGIFQMNVLERAGIPSQDYRPSCHGREKTGCPTKERYRYSVSQVWEGKLTKCHLETGTCTSPLKGHDCILYVCEDIRITCPPPYVKKCPGWTRFHCGNPEGESLPYWMHHCSPIAIPMDHIPITIACKPIMENNRYQCYLTQKGALIASIGMQCETGTCIYTKEGVDHHHHRWRDAGSGKWFREHQAELVLALMWLILLLMLGIAIFFIRNDKKRSLQRAEEWVTDQPIVPHTPQSRILRMSGETQPANPLVFHFEEIEYYVRLRGGKIKQVLRNVHGLAAPIQTTDEKRCGSMLAIMGPSGAGKTSLMDILTGYRRVGVSGRISVNGKTMMAGDRMMRRTAGYVMQDDVLPGTSTVFEYLLFNAALRMPSSVTRAEKEQRVFYIIQKLGLVKVAHNFVGDQFTRGLSGGEKRRVSIACELLVGLRLVFLDEPTTGLDSTNARKVVDILSNMALDGVAVVMTIHQPRPDLFRILDRAMLLSGRGQVVYSGPALEAERYFVSLGHVSPQRTVHIMDYMLDVVIRHSTEEVNALVQNFADSIVKMGEDEYARTMRLTASEDPVLKFRPSFYQQVRCLSTRLMRNTSRHPFLIAVNFVATLAVAIALGLLFNNTGKNTEGIQSRLGVLFFILMFLSTMSLSSLPVWREESLLFKRERGNGVYGASAYFLSVLLFDLIPLRVLPPMFFSTITYWLIDLHEGCALCICWFTLITVMTNVVAALTSMTIGAATPTNAVANALGSLFVLVSMLFAGYFLNKDAMPKWCEVFSAISYLNYGYSGLIINEFHNAPGEFVFTALISSDDFVPLRIKGAMVLCEFGFDNKLFPLDIVVLFVFGGICCLVTYLLLLVSGWDLSPSLNLDTIRSLDAQQKENGLGSVLVTASSEGEALPQDSGSHCRLNIPGPSESGQLVSEISEEDPNNRISATWDARHASPLLQGSPIATDAERRRIMLASVESGERETERLTLSWKNITCVVSSTLLHEERMILKGIGGIAGPMPIAPANPPPLSLEVSKGSILFAIMGPSGAGKTTLIDILAGRKRDVGVAGEIRINGRPVTASITRKLSGYVLQDNVLPATPTVFEHVMFHAQLRIPNSNDSPRQRERALKDSVLHVCHKLGLKEVLDSRIGDAHIRGISGGERRRVSIACELLAGPGIMFLDEPTTGLDSTNAAQVVDILSDMAKSGVTVIMSIHQPRPSFFSRIDKIMMLSGVGEVAFTGFSSTAQRHFEALSYVPENDTMDIIDFILDLVIQSDAETVQRIVNSYQDSDAYREDIHWAQRICDSGTNPREVATWKEFLSSHVKYQASHWNQIKVLSYRMGRNLYRHPLLLYVNFLSSLFVSLVLGSVYWNTDKNTAGIQNRVGALFFTITYLSLMSLSSLPLWHDERLLFVRERAAGAYGTTSYFLANLLFDVLPMRVIPPCFFALFTYWMIGLNLSIAAVIRFLVVLVLCNIASSTFSLAIGAMLDSTSMANMIASLFLLMANLLGGFFLARKRLLSGVDKIVDILSKLSYVRYAFEALMVNEFHHEGEFAFTASRRCIPGSDHDKGVDVDGDDVLRTLHFPTSWSNYYADLLALLLFIFIHSMTIFILFKFRDRPGEPPLWNKIMHKIKQAVVRVMNAWSKALRRPTASDTTPLLQRRDSEVSAVLT